jgi:hypothetical protein
MSQAKVPLRVTAAEYRRSQGQRQAQRNGAGWENVFQGHAARSGVLCIRFPNGCKTIPGPGGKPRLIRVRTPFDWILSHQGKAGFVDTKSTTELDVHLCTQVSDHQLAALRALEMQGHVCGYVVFFPKAERRRVLPCASVGGTGAAGQSAAGTRVSRRNFARTGREAPVHSRIGWRNSSRTPNRSRGARGSWVRLRSSGTGLGPGFRDGACHTGTVQARRERGVDRFSFGSRGDSLSWRTSSTKR